MRRVELDGRRFGRLQVLKPGARSVSGRFRWLCLCDCGNTTDVVGSMLTSGNTRSCGCLKHEMVAQKNTSHGLSRDLARLSSIWSAMRQRCSNPNNKRFHNYGGRGIKVCARWDDFSKFVSDMGERPSSEFSIDRIDNNGDYEPGNCRWATAKVQANNFRRNRLVTFGGKTLSLSEWEVETGIKQNTIRLRLDRGWPIERALTEHTRGGI